MKLILKMRLNKRAFLISISSLSTLLFAKDSAMNQPDSAYYPFYIFMGVFLLSPIFTILQIKKLYETNTLFQGIQNYTLTNDSINIKGETVDSTQRWSHFYKLKETKQFFLFYQGKMIATLLDKKMFSAGELEEFQNFIKSLPIERA